MGGPAGQLLGVSRALVVLSSYLRAARPTALGEVHAGMYPRGGTEIRPAGGTAGRAVLASLPFMTAAAGLFRTGRAVIRGHYGSGILTEGKMTQWL